MNIDNLINKALLDKDSLELQEELEFVHDELHGRLKHIILVDRINRMIRIAAAVAFVFLFVRARVIDVKYSKLDNRHLIALYFEVNTEFHNNYRSQSIPDDSLLWFANYYHSQEEYSKSANYYYKLYEKDSSPNGALCLAGISKILSGDYVKAIEYLNIMAQEITPFRQTSKYYLAWAYLHNSDEQSAYDLFSEIAQDPDYYHYYIIKAKEIVNKINIRQTYCYEKNRKK